MTPAERTKYLGHWSTAHLALKDAYRMLRHLWKCARQPGCDTCMYIDRRLRATASDTTSGKDRQNES